MSMLKIPMGNDFILRYAPADVAPATASGITFAAIDSLNIYVVKECCGKRIPLTHTVDESGCLEFTVPSEAQVISKYSVEMTGTYNDNEWRYKEKNAFQIVDSNNESNVTANETFSAEKYDLTANILTIMTEHIVSCTMEEYEEMANHDNDTYYAIHE